MSTPATLTPVGYLQFETGAVGAMNSPEFSSRTSVNEVLKFSSFPSIRVHHCLGAIRSLPG